MRGLLKGSQYMKKIIPFFKNITILFIGFSAITYNSGGNTKTSGQESSNLNSNKISPGELDSAINTDERVLVYFYSPQCSYCKETTPIIVPLSNDMGINLYHLNLYEYEVWWDKYNIEGTPTLIHYYNGEEISRLVGAHSKSEFDKYFKEYKNF